VGIGVATESRLVERKTFNPPLTVRADDKLIPIIVNHDYRRVIGIWNTDGVGTFADDQKITRDQLFNIFGGAGVVMLECFMEGEQTYVKKFKIIEFSLQE